MSEYEQITEAHNAAMDELQAKYDELERDLEAGKDVLQKVLTLSHEKEAKLKAHAEAMFEQGETYHGVQSMLHQCPFCKALKNYRKDFPKEGGE